MVVGLEFCHSGLSGIFLYFQDGFPTSGNDILARPTTMTHTLLASHCLRAKGYVISTPALFVISTEGRNLSLRRHLRFLAALEMTGKERLEKAEREVLLMKSVNKTLSESALGAV